MGVTAEGMDPVLERTIGNAPDARIDRIVLSEIARTFAASLIFMRRSSGNRSRTVIVASVCMTEV